MPKIPSAFNLEVAFFIFNFKVSPIQISPPISHPHNHLHQTHWKLMQFLEERLLLSICILNADVLVSQPQHLWQLSYLHILSHFMLNFSNRILPIIFSDEAHNGWFKIASGETKWRAKFWTWGVFGIEGMKDSQMLWPWSLMANDPKYQLCRGYWG